MGLRINEKATTFEQQRYEPPFWRGVQGKLRSTYDFSKNAWCILNEAGQTVAIIPAQDTGDDVASFATQTAFLETKSTLQAMFDCCNSLTAIKMMLEKGLAGNEELLQNIKIMHDKLYAQLERTLLILPVRDGV